MPMSLSQNRKFYFYLLCSIFWFIIIMYLMIFYKSNTNIITYPYSDKIIHFILFFVQSMFITKTYIARNFKSDKLMPKIIFYFLIFCFSLELIQIYLPYRSFELLDLTSNLIGSISGAFFVFFLESKI
jgi:VanZ family protein